MDSKPFPGDIRSDSEEAYKLRFQQFFRESEGEFCRLYTRIDLLPSRHPGNSLSQVLAGK